MMSHADTLRGMAKAFMMVGSHERVETCLAAADAMDTLDQVQGVLDRLDREYQNVARSNPLPRTDQYADGYLAGISTAHQWIKQATGGTP